MDEEQHTRVARSPEAGADTGGREKMMSVTGLVVALMFAAAAAQTVNFDNAKPGTPP